MVYYPTNIITSCRARYCTLQSIAVWSRRRTYRVVSEQHKKLTQQTMPYAKWTDAEYSEMACMYDDTGNIMQACRRWNARHPSKTVSETTMRRARDLVHAERKRKRGTQAASSEPPRKLRKTAGRPCVVTKDMRDALLAHLRVLRGEGGVVDPTCVIQYVKRVHKKKVSRQWARLYLKQVL